MSLATMIGIAVGLIVALGAIIYLFGRRATPGAVGSVLRWLAFAITLGTVITFLGEIVADGGAVAAVQVLGLPLIATLAPVIADVMGRAVGAVTTVAAIVMMVWGALLALVFGPLFLIQALLLGLAAVSSVRPRHRDLVS